MQKNNLNLKIVAFLITLSVFDFFFFLNHNSLLIAACPHPTWPPLIMLRMHFIGFHVKNQDPFVLFFFFF